MKPLVSILIANYNNGVYIEQAIISVVQQTYTNWEIVIVDDASTDDSWLLIETLALTYPNIYIYRNDRNLKVGATKARATNLANGSICAILDPDDALEPTAIEEHVLIYIEDSECSLVGSNYYNCDEYLKISSVHKGIYQPAKSYSYLASKGGIHHFWSFDKQKYNLTQGFDARFILAEDQDLFYKLEEVGKIYVIEKPLYRYRIHKNAISQGDKVALAFAYHILARYDALKRRKNRLQEVEFVKNAVLLYLDWGLIRIEKSLRIDILRGVLIHFPELLFKKKVLSAVYHLLR